MNALDLVRAFYDYNEWANGHVLDAASRLREEELARDLGASFGSVQGNLAHTLGAQGLWLSRWTDGPPPSLPSLEDGRVMETLRPAYDTSHTAVRAYLEPLTEDDLGRVFSYVDTQGVAQERLLSQSLLHVVNHGTHHRAESALLLTALGQPPRQLDYVFFEIERAGGAPRLT